MGPIPENSNFLSHCLQYYVSYVTLLLSYMLFSVFSPSNFRLPFISGLFT